MQIEFITRNKVQIFDTDYSVNNKIIFSENITGKYIATSSNNLNNPDSFVDILEDASDPNYYPFYESDLSFIRQAYDPAYVEFLFFEKV